MLPSTIIKTHQVTLRDGSGYMIDSDTAARITRFRNDPGRDAVSFPLIDPQTKALIRDIGKYEIRSLGEVREDERAKNLTEMRWVCGYGVRHFMHQWNENGEKCDCHKAYGHEYKFLDWIRRSFPKKINYHSDITDHMRNEYLRLSSLAA